MNVHVSYKTGKSPEVELEFRNQLEKLARRLQVFNPQLVHFHAIVDKANGQGANVALNLRLPTGQLAAQESGEMTVASVKAAFSDLVAQLTRHKEMLRGAWSWKGRRRESAPERNRVPGLPELGLMQPPTSPENLDAGRWLNANLHRLERFIDRELRYRVLNGQIREDQVTREEVVDEVVVSALTTYEIAEPPQSEPFPLEGRLYRLALQAIRSLVRSNADIAAVSLDAPAGSPNVTGSDENLLQFHQSDDAHSEESVIADRSVRTPEEIFAGEEMVAQLDLVLHGLSAREREVFVLCTLEGFTVDEISRITDLTREQVRKAIWHAREWVRRKLPAENELRRSLLRGSQVA